MYNYKSIYSKFFLFLIILKLFLAKKYNLCIDCNNHIIHKELIDNNISCKYINFELDENFNESNIISLVLLKYNKICDINNNNKNINQIYNNYKKYNFNGIKIDDIKKEKTILINIQ